MKRRFYFGLFAFHFYLVLTSASRGLLADLGQGSTLLPPAVEQACQRAEDLVSAGLGKTLSPSHPLYQVVGTYLACAGIENGYGFFAPNVPNSSKLVFELHYADGRVGYELPRVSTAAAGLRLISVLDYISQADYEPLRRVMLKMLAYSVWQEHPEATTIRAVYGYVDEPTLDQAEQGRTESYHFLYAYDFNFRSEPQTPNR